MKLPPHAFLTYWSAHAWAGVLVSLLTNLIFFTGVFALFRDETRVWEEPRVHSLDGCRGPDGRALPLQPIAEAALASVDFTPNALELSGLDLGCAPVHARLRGVAPDGEALDETLLFDRRGGAPFEQRADVADTLFHLHFFYDGDTTGRLGMWLAGLVGVLLLLALLTGVLLHLKDLSRQLHQLRLHKGLRVAWSDLHKVLGLVGLPFTTMMALTGAIVCLAQPVLGLWSAVVFDGGSGEARAAFFDSRGAAQSADEAAEMRSIDALIADARRAAPGLEPRYVRIRHHGDAAANARIAGRVPELFGNADVTLSAVDGALLGVTAPRRERAITATQRWIYGLHFAWYGGLPLRLLYALLGLAGCVMMLSGNWIWLQRRDRTRARRSSRLLGRFTIAGGLGPAPAVAAMFFANRAVPIAASWHAEAELAAFVGLWIAAGVLAFAARSERVAAARVLAVAGALFVLAPMVGAFQTPLHLGAALTHGAWSVATVDLLLLTCGFASLATAWAAAGRARLGASS